MEPFIVLEKKVGETPLQVLEAYKAGHPELLSVPMAYAGRLDPMASGKLLVLLGEECKVQEKYHDLDKEYEFEVLFGVGSDSGDVLGLLETGDKSTIEEDVAHAIKPLVGEIELPYPHFSSKTVQGKPLHTWKVEGRIGEIAIPTKRSHIYKLELLETQTKTAQEVYEYATKKIETIPKVIDERKALGNDFRRDEVRTSWKIFFEHAGSEKPFTIAKFRCVCSSGTYMRTLSEVIAQKLGTKGLAYSIHRTKIGRYTPLPFGFGFWSVKF
jgi:tRNA pseudouridine(55) synthase